MFLLWTASYNELGMHLFWPTKQLGKALGYTILEFGATIIASLLLLIHLSVFRLISLFSIDRGKSLDSKSITALILSGFIILTTSWVQDLHRGNSDPSQWHSTSPNVIKASRLCLPSALIVWWIVLLEIWKLDNSFAIPLLGLTVAAGRGYQVSASSGKEGESFVMYNVSISELVGSSK